MALRTPFVVESSRLRACFAHRFGAAELYSSDADADRRESCSVGLAARRAADRLCDDLGEGYTFSRLPGERRKILAVAEDRCSDSAWAVPYLAKLAAAVPDKIDVRVIARREGRGIQAGHLTPDGRRATPTIIVLDEHDRVLGAWVERPSELQKWYVENKPTMSSDELHEYMDRWYADDAGRSTINDVLAIVRRTEPEAK
jgi:hypothetical protein